jgi:hypothetical protein
MDPDPYSESGSTKSLNPDPIRIRIHNPVLKGYKTDFQRVYLILKFSGTREQSRSWTNSTSRLWRRKIS